MTKLLRRVALVMAFFTAITAPWVAVALYNIDPRALEQGIWGVLQEETGFRILNLNRSGYVQKLGANQEVRGELDVRELYVHIPDIGVASSHYVVVPSTGIIVGAWATTNVGRHTAAGAGPTLGVATVLRMYSNRIGGEGPFIGTNRNSEDARVTNFLITMPSTARQGDAVQDDSINQPINMGDRIAIGTDGGTAETGVAGVVTILIRMQ